VEHVRRLNERGNRLLLLPSPSDAELERAARLFEHGAFNMWMIGSVLAEL